ncbi:anthranilate synthase component I [candidate division WOR-3 bacterium]|nr:anthranilate synthase component I [candidate division WOR-3 bacterium]
MPSVFQHEPLIERVDGDQAPIKVFQHFYNHDRYAFLYESMERMDQRGRYSIIGGRPAVVFQARGQDCRIMVDTAWENCTGDPFSILEHMIEPGKRLSIHDVFGGGAVGYVSYDAVRHIEHLPDTNPEDPQLPEFSFIFPTEIIVFDHYEKTVCVICYGKRKRLQELVATLREDHDIFERVAQSSSKITVRSSMTRQEFCAIVERAKHHIRNGDIFQVVLSQRFSIPIQARSFSIYRNLRYTNPSPYMYFLNMDELAVLGSSPETLIKLQNNKVASVPIAGTRPRGRDEHEDKRMADELLGDEKERAEHIMLVDLARNDIGRVCVYGSVSVVELMKIERFSKVMHITSQVIGDLRSGVNAFDVFKAAFPAGTVSGAPKVRAMEIIDELENVRRGIYAGAIGYFGFDGNMDFCIAIRTIIMHGQTAYIQGGAGIVADSIPEHEYDETMHKTEALQRAVEIAS